MYGSQWLIAVGRNPENLNPVYLTSYLRSNFKHIYAQVFQVVSFLLQIFDKTLCAFLFKPTPCVLHSLPLILLECITLIIFSVDHKCKSLPLPDFLHSPVTPSVILSNAISPCSSLKARVSFSHLYQAVSSIITCFNFRGFRYGMRRNKRL
jgi:hypothetical protein